MSGAGVRTVTSLALAMLLLGAAPPATECASPKPEREGKREGYVPLGSRIPRWVEKIQAPEQEAVKVMHEFASCIAQTQRKKSAALLTTMPDSKEQKASISELVGQPTSCLRASRMRLTSTLFRGAIAEALLKREPSVAQRQLPSGRPPQDFESVSAGYLRSLRCPSENARSEAVGRWLAYCAAHEHPTSVRDFLGTRPGSPEEAVGLRSMDPVFDGCLLQGQVLKVDQLTMRALLAEALYQRAAGESAE